MSAAPRAPAEGEAGGGDRGTGNVFNKYYISQFTLSIICDSNIAFTIINFNLKDGLPNNNIIAIHESKDKKLWVAASSGGIALYDGKRFSSVDVTGNVTTIQSAGS